MALYVYLKNPPRSSRTKLLRFNILPYGLIFFGIALLANVLLPILFYQAGRGRFHQELVSPVVKTALLATPIDQKTVLGKTEQAVDFSKLENWFPEAPSLPPKPSKITHYNLSIPVLGIEKAVVQIGGEDLMKSLIHYPGTALPGQYGNAVIFGHSCLPQFFSPKNYKCIFSTLPTLEGSNNVLLDFDGVTYRYQITQIVETRPEDVSVLEQHYDAEYLTLVTCVPPGTYLKRLVVRARLVK